MLKRFLQTSLIKPSYIKCVFFNLSTFKSDTNLAKDDEILNRNSVFSSNLVETSPKTSNVLEPLSEDISHISTYLKPTFNVASYANKSEIIQELIKLGVDFYLIEKKVSEAVPFLLKLKFEDIKEYVLFLNSLGLQFDDVGNLITKNPLIFKENLQDLEVRINYLKFKKFTDEMIARIISKNAFWLSYSTQEIDSMLGFFQKNFQLSGEQVRTVAVMKPQLITFNQKKVKINMFAIKEEMGFSQEHMQRIILRKPGLFMNTQHRIVKSFDYLHNVMNICIEQLVETPEILTTREKRLKERHQFLVKLKRDQFDPRKPNYISLMALVSDTDANFATDVAKSRIEEYNMYLKTL